jgi:hypothetical protein
MAERASSLYGTVSCALQPLAVQRCLMCPAALAVHGCLMCPAATCSGNCVRAGFSWHACRTCLRAPCRFLSPHACASCASAGCIGFVQVNSKFEGGGNSINNQAAVRSAVSAANSHKRAAAPPNVPSQPQKLPRAVASGPRAAAPLRPSRPVNTPAAVNQPPAAQRVQQTLVGLFASQSR